MKEKMKIENLESDSIELLKRATKEAQQGIRSYERGRTHAGREEDMQASNQEEKLAVVERRENFLKGHRRKVEEPLAVLNSFKK